MIDAIGNDPVEIERCELVTAYASGRGTGYGIMYVVTYRYGNERGTLLSPSRNPARIAELVRFRNMGEDVDFYDAPVSYS